MSDRDSVSPVGKQPSGQADLPLPGEGGVQSASSNQNIVQSLSEVFDPIARRLTPDVEPATEFRLT